MLSQVYSYTVFWNDSSEDTVCMHELTTLKIYCQLDVLLPKQGMYNITILMNVLLQISEMYTMINQSVECFKSCE